jgi:two-component system cell cycle sensor histidine kinase/response regulator CckA
MDYQVETVSSGEEAVLFLKKQSADILLLDMLMPPGQNGRITYEQILQFQPQQKAVIASGYAKDDHVRETMEMGAGAFLPKPYTLVKLGAAIYTTLRT